MIARRFVADVLSIVGLVLLTGVVSFADGEPLDDGKSCTICLDRYQSYRDDYERAQELTIMCKRVAMTRDCLANIQKHNRRCRSNIQLQVFRMGFNLEVKKYSCDKLNVTLPSQPVEALPSTTRAPRPTLADRCKFKGQSREDEREASHSPHCGLFGDPHLRTFNGMSQTCAVEGAWPLFNSKYLAVQVTNVKLGERTGATATNKITVVVKETKDSCAEQKIYQVTSGHLPLEFRDGSSSTGPVGCQAKIIKNNDGVRLDICHLNTTIVIRPVGKYLTFSMKMPDSLVGQVVASGLCVAGCPADELINYENFFESQSNLVEHIEQHRTMLSKDAFILCEQSNLTDFYFDSCLFDLMTTGDRQFAMSARTAMMDAINLNPRLRLARDNSVALRKRSSFISGAYDASSPPNSRSGSILNASSGWTLTALLLVSYLALSWAR